MDYTEEEWWGYEEERRYWEEQEDYLAEAQVDWNTLCRMMYVYEAKDIVRYLEAAAQNGADYLEYVSRPVDPNPPF